MKLFENILSPVPDYRINLIASADKTKRVTQACETVDRRTAGYKNRRDAVLHKPQATIKMIHELAMFVDFNRPHSIFGSLCVKTGKHGIPVKLVFVRNRNKKSEYVNSA